MKKNFFLSLLVCLLFVSLLLPLSASALQLSTPQVYVDNGQAVVTVSAYDYTTINYYMYDTNKQLIAFARDQGTTWYPLLRSSGDYRIRAIATNNSGKVTSSDSGYVYVDLQNGGGVVPTVRPTLPPYVYVDEYLSTYGTVLPPYQSGSFTRGLAVYQGPGTDYYRSNNGRALVGAKSDCRIFGIEQDWLLISYATSSGAYRMGYVTDYSFYRVPEDYLSYLSYNYIPCYVRNETVVTDDPFFKMPVIDILSANKQVTFLAWVDYSKQYAMIEYYSDSLRTYVRAFVKGDSLLSDQPTPPYITPRPTIRPTLRPTVRPTVRPTLRPTLRPTVRPTLRPTVHPTPVPVGKQIVLPNYEKGKFKGSHAVYQGPDTGYYRSAKGKASVGGGTCRIYGKDGSWLLIGYGLSNGGYRIGYINNPTLPSNINAADLQEINYAWINTFTINETPVTDDPVIKTAKIDTIPANTAVTFLAWADSSKRYALVEYFSAKHGQTVRAFVRGHNLDGF